MNQPNQIDLAGPGVQLVQRHQLHLEDPFLLVDLLILRVRELQVVLLFPAVPSVLSHQLHLTDQFDLLTR